MSDNPFYRLAPFIQEFIYRKGWDELRNVQVEAARAVFDSPNHILIMSGTASGKTEAAFLPILTDLYENPVAGIGILYIGPLKALINNQFERLLELLEESHIPVQSWHGDIDLVAQAEIFEESTRRLTDHPELLEAMLILRHQEMGRLFGSLRYVLIDEVHAFMNADRGQQILCQLERLRAFQSTAPRRIGLSATLGDPAGAAYWLAGNTGVPVTIVNDMSNKRTLELALWHFVGPPSDYEDQLEKAQRAKLTEMLAELNALTADHRTMLRQMLMQTQHKKSIIFTNSRGDAEMLINGIRAEAEREHAPDIYHVHHGNIAAPLRAAAETAMQTDGQSVCVGATITLELGIDVGQLDQVLQFNSTYTVTSFVQRLGRAGRRDGRVARMLFYHEEEPIDEHTHAGEQIPWDLLQTIAIIQLYLEEKWVEPGAVHKLPFSLLFHQTLSVLTAFTELSPPELAQRVLTLPPFKGVSQEHFRVLLRSMLDARFLERAENGKLIVGLNAERIVNNYRFYAVFPDEETFIVRDGTREIGSIQSAPPIDSVFRLAGFAWKTLEIDEKRHVIHAERVARSGRMLWTGGVGEIHDKVVARVRQLLLETEAYSYLQSAAVDRLTEARHVAAEYDLATQSIVDIGGDHVLFFPWQGSRIFKTLGMFLKVSGGSLSHMHPPYFMEVGNTTRSALQALLQRLRSAPPSLESLTAQLSLLELQNDKFDTYIPVELRREAYGMDRLAYDEAIASTVFGNIPTVF